MGRMPCPFCTIDEIKTRTLEEGNLIRVVLSNPRLTPGHLLVIPKRHAEALWELNAEEERALFETAIKYQKRIVEKFSTGCDLRQNYRPFLPESEVKVNHMHLHLVPRNFEDELYQKSQRFEREMFQPLPADAAAEISKILNE